MVAFLSKIRAKVPILSVYQEISKAVFQIFGPMGEWASFIEEM